MLILGVRTIGRPANVSPQPIVLRGIVHTGRPGSMAMAVTTQTHAADDALRAEKRRLWLERASRELDMAEAWQADRKPDPLIAHLDRMLEISARTDSLSSDDKLGLANQVRTVERKVYEKHIDYLLEQAMVVTRDKERQLERGELIRGVNDALNVAARLGISDAIKQGIKDRLEIIQHTSVAGESSGAKKDAEREAGLVEAAHPRELRTFTRWRQPPLKVAIGGRAFETADWSLGGALIAEVEGGSWKCGQTIDVKIGLPDGKLHGDKMVVVRYSPEQKRLAIRSRRFASVLMQVKRDCDAAGLEPV